MTIAVDMGRKATKQTKQTNKQLLVSQMQILDVKTWLACGGLVVVWGVSTHPDRSYHFTKNISFQG